MNIRDEKKIKVLNYNETFLSIKTNIRSYVLPMGSIAEPTFDYLSFEEIEYVNSNTNGIKTGLIRFESEKENEIYKELGIDVSTIIKNEDIENILLNPTKESIKKIISITDFSIFQRAYRIFIRLKNTNKDISVQTARFMEQRMNEFNRGITNTDIKLGDDDIVESKSDKTSRLENEIEQLKSMIAMLTKANTDNKEIIENNSESKTDNTEIKRGRPKTKKEINRWCD